MIVRHHRRALILISLYGAMLAGWLAFARWVAAPIIAAGEPGRGLAVLSRLARDTGRAVPHATALDRWNYFSWAVLMAGLLHLAIVLWIYHVSPASTSRQATPRAPQPLGQGGARSAVAGFLGPDRGAGRQPGLLLLFTDVAGGPARARSLVLLNRRLRHVSDERLRAAVQRAGDPGGGQSALAQAALRCRLSGVCRRRSLGLSARRSRVQATHGRCGQPGCLYRTAG